MCCEYWIGGNDLHEEGTFTWTSDNSKFEFVNWYPGEPDNYISNEHCVAICEDNHWRDSQCHEVWPYICKAPAM
ncbi:salivary C-type lectin 2-like [Crassostrea virginica]